MRREILAFIGGAALALLAMVSRQPPAPASLDPRLLETIQDLQADNEHLRREAFNILQPVAGRFPEEWVIGLAEVVLIGGIRGANQDFLRGALRVPRRSGAEGGGVVLLRRT